MSENDKSPHESASDPSDGGSPVHVLDYLRVLSRWRVVSLIAMVVVWSAGAFYALLTPPVYRAQTRILIEPQNSTLVSAKDAFERNEGDREYLETQLQVLRSRSLAERTIGDLQLWTRPEFGGADSSNAQPPHPSSLVDAFLGRLSVELVTGSRLVDVRFESTDADLTALAVNTLAKNYIAQDVRGQVVSTQGTSEWLQEHVDAQRKKVEASEQALQAYRRREGVLFSDDRQNIVTQKLAELNTAVTLAKTNRIGKEELFTQLESLKGDPEALDSFPAILANPFIQQLKAELAELQREETRLSQQYGDEHPAMVKIRSTIAPTQARLRGEIAKVVQSVRSDYLSAQAQENSLVTALEQQKREAQDLNGKGIQYAALEREARSNREALENLLKESAQIGFSADLERRNVRVVDVAPVPLSPVRPQKVRDLSIAILSGLLVAFGIAFLLEYLDPRIRLPEQLTGALGLPFVSVVPQIPANNQDGRLHPDNGMPPDFAEAFRRLRTSLVFSSNGHKRSLIMVTSSGPQEGKSTVASNLAVALSRTNQRVLLVDTDMRRSSVHHLFTCDRSPGLSDLLQGKARPSEVIRSSTVPGLSLLVAGTPVPNPNELLSLPLFKATLGALAPHFDWVVIDAPPVMAVADASVVAPEVAGVLFVVGAGMTRDDVARNALAELRRSQVTILGAVLNRVNLQRDGYYYSRYYSKEYASYYSEPDATETSS